MSKKRNQIDYSKFETLYTPEQVKLKNEKNLTTLYSAGQYSEILKQRAEEERQRKLREQQLAAEQQRRHQTYLNDYKMRKQYGFGTNIMNNPQRMKYNRFVDQLLQPKAEEEESKPLSFEEAGRISNLLNPKSALNKTIGKQPQNVQDAYATMRNNINQALGGKSVSEVFWRTNTPRPENPLSYEQYITDVNRERERDLYEGDDLTRYGDNQLQKKYEEDLQKSQEAERRHIWDSIHGEGAYDSIDRRSIRWNRMNAEIDELMKPQQDWRPSYQQGKGNNYYNPNMPTRTVEEIVNGPDGKNAEAVANGRPAKSYGDYDRIIEADKAEIERRQKVNELEQNAPAGEYKYDPSLVKTVKFDKNKMRGIGDHGPMLLWDEGLIGDETDRIYQMIGEPFNPVGSEYFYGDNDTELAKLGNADPAYFMLPEQKNAFLAYYLNGDKASAKAYYEALYPSLLSLRGEYKSALTQQMSKDEYAQLMVAMRAALPEVGGAMSTAGTIASLFGDKNGTNPYSDYYEITNTMGDIQQARSEVWGDWFADKLGEEYRDLGQRLNGLGYSVIDNARRRLITMGFSGAMGADMASKTAKTFDFLLLSSDVAGSTMADALKKNMDPTEAFIRAGGAALIEVLTENMWWDKVYAANVKDMLGKPGQVGKYLKNIFKAEGSEELSGNVLDTLFDVCVSELYGHENELAAKHRELVENQHMDPAQASWVVLGDWMKEAGWAYLSGGMSALISGGTQTALARYENSSENAKIGEKAIRSGINTEADDRNAQLSKEVKNLFTIIETGEGFRAGTETKAIADEIRADIRKGKTPDKGRVGALVRSIVSESNETVSNTMKNVLQEAFAQELQSGGMGSEEAAQQAAALANMVAKGEYTKDTMRMIAGSEGARKILAEYHMGGFAEETKKAEELTQQEREAQKSVMELLGVDYKAKESDVAGSMEDANWLKEGDEELRTAEGERTGDPTEVVANGKIGKIVGFEVKEYRENDTKYWKLQAKVQYGGETEAQNVDMDDVRAIGENGGKLLRFLANENGQSIGENAARELLRISGTTKNIAGAVTDTINIAMEAYGLKKTKVLNLSTEEEKAVRAAVEADLQAEDAAAANNSKALKPGQGVVTFDGQEYGSKGFADKLGKLSRQIRDEANYVAHLMKSVGMDVEFYYDASKEGSANQGAFIGEHGIRINLAGTFSTDGTHRSVVATTAHESLHWLRANSPAAYRQMRAFILNNLERVGMNVQSELRRVMDNYGAHGEHLTMGGAIEEIVAMANERVLTNEKLISELQEEDPRLYGKVKRAVQHVIEKLRGVRDEAEKTSSRYARKLDGALDEIARAWKLMLDEAKGIKKGSLPTAAGVQAPAHTSKTTGGSLTSSNNVSHSYRDVKRENRLSEEEKRLDEEYLQAIKDGNKKKQLQMLREKLHNTKGIYPFYAPRMYKGEYAEIARQIKEKDQEAIRIAAKEMAEFVPDDAVLIPMPGHTGKVSETSDTMALANEISRITGKPVIVALEGVERESRYKAKRNETKGVSAEEMGFRQVKEIPEGKIPIIIDNVVSVGETAKAAIEALDNIDSTVLSYAKGITEKVVWGLKAAFPTEHNGKTVDYHDKFNKKERNWRLSLRDEDYMAAVNSGDMENAQRMVDEAAKAAGYTMKVYHGTPTGGFTVFRGWSYFTENKAYADRYNHASASSIRGSYETTTPQTYELYMNPGKVFDTRKAREKKLYNEARMEYGMGELTETDSGLPDWTNGGDLVDFIEERELDYDTIMLDEGADGGYGEEVVKRGISYLTRSNNVKSADPVVYDNDGNVIPLSERFNTEKQDIRWSIREDGNRLESEYKAAYDRYTDLRLEVSKLKGDVDAFNERIKNLKTDKEHEDLVNEMLEWQERTGYAKLQEDLKEAEKEWKDAQKALDEYTEQRDVAEEQEKIRESGMTEAEWRRKQAINTYGYTGDFREAGYLLPNGRMLNFCGSKGQHYGMRGNDHRDIGQLYASGEMQGSAAMIAFMKDGNIRVMAETPGIDISTAQEPTSAQYTAIRNMAYKFASDEYFSVDLTDERGNNVGNYEYEGDINPSRIVNDIRYYFQNGKVREQSTVSMFHNAMFSIRDDTDYDVRQWMETVPEWSLQTEAEKQLLSKYKGLQMKQRLDRERMRKIDSDLLKLEAQLTEERTGRIEAEETMENALESAGVSVRDGHFLQKDGKIIGKINADGTIGLNKGVEENVYQTLRAAGFGFNNKKGIFRPVKSAPQNADGKPTITALLGKSEAQRQRDALQKRKQDLQKTMDEQEVKLAEITKDEGFGKMMYQQQKVLDDLQSFGTQRELMDYVARMEKKAREVAARIEENRKATEALEKGDVVKRFRELLGTTTAEKTAAELKKEFSSTWTAKQIQAYLNPIILKMKSGQDFQQDIETLAGILVSSDSRNRYEALEDLRGLVITIGKGAQQELKAQNSSLKEVRARLAGTGIQVKYGDRSTLEADIEDLRAEYPMIPELGDEKDALGNFLNWVDSMKSASAGMEFYDQRIAEAMAVITGKAAGAAKGIYMPNDPKAQQQVLAIMDFVKGLNAETAEVQKALADIAAQMGEMQKAGMAATNRATTLMRDVNVAIDYYQKIGKIAADEAKQKKQSAVIEQLKSKHAEEIVKNNEEWRALVQRDKDARAQLDENRKMTRQINTNLKRTFNLLKNPKGLQNIPEYMQGLAREVISKFVDNDMGRGARFIQATQKELTEWRRILDAWEAQNGKFDRTQLGAMDAENVKADVVLDDLDKITEGMKQLNAWKIYGKNKLDALQQRGAIIEQIRDAVSEIYTAIRAEGEVQAGDRRVAVEDAAYEVAKGTGGKKYREWTGSMGQKMGWLHKAIVYGNMTPEYFFRTLGNQGLSDLWENYHWAENRNGLELKKAKDRLAQIAEEYGYKNWDMKQKIKLNLQSGEVEITLGQLMSLWATWKRETTLGPAMSEHLTKGGFYAEPDLLDGLLGRQVLEKRAHRVTEEDMEMVRDKLTEEQRKFIDDVVGYMSRDMRELGNEASMAAYGVKLYKESYYFPFQMWDGVKSRKSNDAGGAAAANDRAFHPSFSKSRQHGANNAVMIGDFMQVATDHIAGMINYATMGLANENLQKVLNAQTAEEYDTKRNTWALIEEAYGREAAKYLADLQLQLNGGAVKTERSIGDKIISLFRKNAVAGSLSVALQQPLSYIRAAMMINPKYLTQAVMKEYWKGSYKELLEHSGVAVIKDMGRFDMNAGQSAREYLTPDGFESKGRKVWNAIGEYSTILPEKMDAWTWTRMWVAVKAEQHAEHPEMDMKSDEFMEMCGKRFNDIMRRTQVYDSTLVKSANMRSTNYFTKNLTSFMAEPTLTMNVMADAIRMAKNHEKGGIRMVRKAGTMFILTAVLSAAVKGLYGAGRNPDEKKTFLENFLYRFWMNLLGEVNPFGLIPGYSDVVTLLKDGELSDDAMGAIGKIATATKGTVNLVLNGASDKGLERDLEDTVGQLAQIFTNIPAKNLMRDARAMVNFITQPYANRANNWGVIKYQTEQAMMNTDTMISALLKDAGFKTTNAAYYDRIYQAKKAGNNQAAQDMIDYLLHGKGVKQEDINSGVTKAAKADDSISVDEKAEMLGGDDATWWKLDRDAYKKETGKDVGTGYYYRLTDAIDSRKSDVIKTAVKQLQEHGISNDKIKGKLSDWKKEYLEAKGNEKVQLKNALIMAYKALGYSDTEANEIINKWK